MSRPVLPCSIALLCLGVACGGGVGDERASVGPHVHSACIECVVAGRSAVSEGGEAGQLEGTVGAAGEGGATSDRPAAPVAGAGLAIAEVSFWQALRVPLELRGVTVPPIVPIVPNKEGIFRVYVAPDERFRARVLRAVLSFGVGPSFRSLESKKLIRMASNDADFSSTFNFPIDATEVRPDTSYSVTVLDGAKGELLDRFPNAERSALDPVAASPSNSLQVVVVPMIVAGIEPDVSPQTLAKFRARVLSMYPLADIALAVRAPLTTQLDVGPDQGWDALLDHLYALRAQDAPAANVFYYGLFTPTRSFADYCVTDCTVGYSIIPDVDEVESRGSIGLGIFGDGTNRDAPDTMAHELGHALGRRHAPCGTVDPGPFPYPGGKIGVWGFDSPHHLLIDPQLYDDVMGYCMPDWISDYTYRALFTRIRSVNEEIQSAKALWPAPSVGAYRRVLLGSAGSLRWGSRFTPKHRPSGQERVVTLLGANGGALGALRVAFRGFADAQGGFLLVPESALEAGAGVAAIRVGNAVLALPTP